MKSIIKIFIVIILISISSYLYSSEISVSQFNVQEMKHFLKELGFAFNAGTQRSATTMGVLGLKIGGAASFFKGTRNLWNKAYNDDAPSYLPLYNIYARKGLPFNMDLSVKLSKLHNTDLQLAGISLRRALIKGGIVMPAISLTLDISKLTGGKDIDKAFIYSLKASISKGFGPIKPYFGAGIFKINLDSHSNSYDANDMEIFGGVILNMPLMSVVSEIAIKNSEKKLTLGINFGF